MNIESILNQFELVDESINRAKLPFEAGMIHPNITIVSVYELMKAVKQIENIIKEIDPQSKQLN